MGLGSLFAILFCETLAVGSRNVRLRDVQYEKAITRIILSRETVKRGRKIIQTNSLCLIEKENRFEIKVLSGNRNLRKSLRNFRQ